MSERICECCDGTADDQSVKTRQWLAETGEFFCEACVDEGRASEAAYAAQDHEES